MDGVTILTVIAGVISLVTLIFQNRYSKKTPLEEYESDKKRIDETLASHDIARNSGLLDELLPPANAPDTPGDMQPK